MISERQHEANRRNAAKSHGPITPEGRAAVRMNALKHGLTAEETILPTEDKTEFEQFQAAFEEECQPVGPIEQVLVEDIVAARWRMNRVRKMEPGFFAFRREDMKNWINHFPTLDAQAKLAMIVHNDAQQSDTLGKMSRYEARFERSFHKALKELQRLQALRAAVSDSGNGTVSHDPVSPAPDPPNPAPEQPQASAPGTVEPEIRNPTSEIPPISPEEVLPDAA
jgi:hypothetical protein